jgi:hypothetical protein
MGSEKFSLSTIHYLHPQVRVCADDVIVQDLRGFENIHPFRVVHIRVAGQLIR